MLLHAQTPPPTCGISKVHVASGFDDHWQTNPIIIQCNNESLSEITPNYVNPDNVRGEVCQIRRLTTQQAISSRS